MGREEGKGWKENGSGRHKDARKGQHVYASPWEEGGGRGGRWERREVVEEGGKYRSSGVEGKREGVEGKWEWQTQRRSQGSTCVCVTMGGGRW